MFRWNTILFNWVSELVFLPTSISAYNNAWGSVLNKIKGILENGIFNKKLNYFFGFSDPKELELLRIERTGETSLSQTGPQQFL